MRLKYFCDRQDRWKWSLIRTHLNENKFSLVYVAMMTDLGWPSRDKLSGSTDTALVNEFQALQDEVTLLVDRRLRSILQTQIQEHAETVVSGYRMSESRAYFESVASRVHNKTSKNTNDPLLIFLDPDTGFSPDSGINDGHVTHGGLEILLKSLRDQDRIWIYQHRQRVADNASDFSLRKGNLRKLLSSLNLNREPQMIDPPGSAEAYIIQL